MLTNVKNSHILTFFLTKEPVLCIYCEKVSVF